MSEILLEQIKQREQAPIIIVIDFPHFYSTLVHKKLIRPVFKTFAVPIPPGFTVDWTVFTPAGKYYLFVENVVSVFPDHALEIAIFIDNEPLHYDPDVVQDRYREAINFLRRYGAVKPVQNNWRIIIKNKSDQTAYWSAFAAYGIIDKNVYETIYDTFFDIIAEALGI
jgi:hypothetical protein